jgi:hypothetical protein
MIRLYTKGGSHTNMKYIDVRVLRNQELIGYVLVFAARNELTTYVKEIHQLK